MSFAPFPTGTVPGHAARRAGFFERLGRGLELTKASLRVIQKDPEILLLPVLSGVAMLLLMAGVFLGFVLGMISGAAPPEPRLFIAAFLIVHFVGYFVIVFFNVGVVAMASIRFDGGDPTVGDGLRAAADRIGLIAKWALVAATVGLLLRMARNAAQQRAGFLGFLLGGFLELAWNVVVYFVVPLLVHRNLGPLAAMKESVQMVRRTWAEAATGEVALGLVFGVLGMVGFLAVVLAWMTFGVGLAFALVVGAVLLYWLVLAVVNAAAQGVLAAALYKYATTGQVPQDFDRATLARAIG